MLYKKHFEREGFDLLVARNGAEALKVVAQTKPDLILMDVMMPAKDGISALPELKQNEATRDVPVIIMTATNVAEYNVSMQEAKLGGAAGLLTKPLSPAKLVSEVRRFFPAR
jgi:CheY-like chemotaxis protein